MSEDKAISIIGASAGVGLLCSRIALERGHRVTTLSRSVDRLPEHPNLRALRGSATDLADLRRASEGADALLVTLGTGMDRKPTQLYTDFGRALLQLQSALGQIPLIVLTGCGAGDSAPYQGPLARLFFRLFLQAVYANKSELEAMLERSSLNWMLVRPGLLTNGDPPGPARVQADYQHGMKVGSVSRLAVARFMVEQAEQPSFLHRKPALSAR